MIQNAAQRVSNPSQTEHETGCEAIASSAAVQRLCAALDAAFDAAFEVSFDAAPGDADAHAAQPEPEARAAFARQVRAALAQAIADPALLTPAQREGSPATYRRHLLAADPQGRYAIAALVWMPGHASPVHAHHTWCGYAVLEGSLTESVYQWDALQDSAIEARQHPRAAGAVSFTRAGHVGIHRLMNASDATAVSVHVYGVAGEQIATHVNDVVRVAEPVVESLVESLVEPLVEPVADRIERAQALATA